MKMKPLENGALLCASLFLIIFVGPAVTANENDVQPMNSQKDPAKSRNKPKTKLSRQLAAAKKVCWALPAMESRIVKGTDPERTSLPWMVALFKEKKYVYKDTVFMCGGALISSRFVLTAAHCYVNDTGHFKVPKVSQLSVRYGMHDLSSKIYKETGVVKVFAHPRYKCNPDDMYNDIALLKLKKVIKYNDIVKPICVPYLTTPSQWNKLKKTKSVIVSGWGRTAPAVESRANLNLQKGVAYIVDNSECSKKFQNYDPGSTICIGSHKNASYVCHGDSGSPVIPFVFLPKKDSTVFSVVIGLVSFGDEGCRGPDVLTKVESFIGWINKMTRK